MGSSVSYPELVDAAVAFKNRNTREIFRLILRRLAITSEEILAEFDVSAAKLDKALKCLVAKGLITESEPEPGALPRYSPTAKGVSVYKSIETANPL